MAGGSGRVLTANWVRRSPGACGERTNLGAGDSTDQGNGRPERLSEDAKVRAGTGGAQREPRPAGKTHCGLARRQVESGAGHQGQSRANKGYC